MRINRDLIELKRAEKSWNQAELASKAGISRQWLNSVLVRGDAPAETVIKIAEALEINPERLLKEK